MSFSKNLKRIFSIKKRNHIHKTPTLASSVVNSNIDSVSLTNIDSNQETSISNDMHGTSTTDYITSISNPDIQTDDTQAITTTFNTNTTDENNEVAIRDNNKIPHKSKHFSSLLIRVFSKRDNHRLCLSSLSEVVPETTEVIQENIASNQSDAPGTSINTNSEFLDSENSLSQQYQMAELEENIENETSQISEEKDVSLSTEVNSIAVSIASVLYFLSNIRQQSAENISAITDALRHPDVINLYHNYGYNKSVLYFCVIQDHLCGKILDDNCSSLLSSYALLNEQRMQDPELFNLFESKLSDIRSIKKTLDKLLKEKISDSLVCIKCQRNMVSILFLPCGHMLLCDQCNQERNDICQCCQLKIAEEHHIFF